MEVEHQAFKYIERVTLQFGFAAYIKIITAIVIWKTKDMELSNTLCDMCE